jgi:hypothetical protein
MYNTKMKVYKITPGLNYIWKNPSLTVDVNPVSGFHFQPVEEAFVRTEFNRLKTNKAIGLDKISASSKGLCLINSTSFNKVVQ